LREQAFRAERLSNTVSDMSASRTLRSLAEQYLRRPTSSNRQRCQARRLRKRPKLPLPKG